MGKFNINNIKAVIKNKDQYLNSDFFKTHKNTFLKVLIGSLLIIAVGVNVASGHEDESKNLEEIDQVDQIEMKQEEEVTENEYLDTIVIDISGAVATPMVVELPSDARINDAIKAAGGLTEDADISSVNRAEVLEDGQKIYIPIKGDNDIPTEKEYMSENFIPKKVNLNTASYDELTTLNGVGPATADKILKYREEEGRFKTIEDLMNVDGIGEKTFEKLKDDIVV